MKVNDVVRVVDMLADAAIDEARLLQDSDGGGIVQFDAGANGHH